MAGNAESERSTDMENEVWSEISAFLNNLRCGDVSRKSYLHFPELEEAEKIRKVKKANFETEMRKLNAEQRQQIENYLEAVQHLAFMEEERAYCQGYVDCIQLLGGLGILNSNPEIEMMVSKMIK